MTVTELLDKIYTKANEHGIDLSAAGLYDDEDIQIRALTIFLNDMEDLIQEPYVENSDEDSDDDDEQDDESDPW